MLDKLKKTLATPNFIEVVEVGDNLQVIVNAEIKGANNTKFTINKTLLSMNVGGTIRNPKTIITIHKFSDVGKADDEAILKHLQLLLSNLLTHMRNN